MNQTESNMSKDLLSVFKRVATVTNEKIDRVLDDVRALPQNLPHVPGIDLTAGGEYLTYEEAVRLKSRQDAFTTQLLALRAAFASVNSLIMNRKVFYELTRSLKLYRIYPPRISPGHAPSYSIMCSDETRVFLRYLEGVSLRSEVSSELLKRVLFADYAIMDGLKVGWGGSAVTFSIKVIPPPEETRRKIIETLALVSESLSTDKTSSVLCTIADENAFQVEGLKVPPAPMRALDPGVVLERGEFVVILTDTFYHVSDLEQQFLDKAEQVAENWQVKQFLLN